jgi:hypothetical protein
MLRDLVKPPSGDQSGSRQLTLADWERAQKADRQRAIESSRPAPDSGSTPFADVVVLADALAPRLAAELAAYASAGTGPDASTAALLIDQLVAEFPPAKRPETWKRWLYERTRRGEVPGGMKIGGMLFFEREPALAWLRTGATYDTLGGETEWHEDRS